MSGRHRLGLFLLAWVGLFVRVSCSVSFLMCLVGVAVLLGASKIGYCYQAHQKGYSLNAPDVFYFPWCATGSSTGAKNNICKNFLLINEFRGTK